MQNLLAVTMADSEWQRLTQERDKAFEALLVFLDWRHKIMLRFMVTLVAVAGAWHYLDPSQWQLRALLLAVGSGACVLFGLMDRINADHLHRLYELGAYLEAQMTSAVGVFGAIRWSEQDAKRVTTTTASPGGGVKLKPRRLRYGSLIEVAYYGSALILALFAVETACGA